MIAKLRRNDACTLTPAWAERRGRIWIVGAFVLCPCHLPITLALAATVLSGTAAGALVAGRPYVAGLLVSLVWLAATWRGFRFLRAAKRARLIATATRQPAGTSIP